MWKLTASERLTRWRDFRRSLDPLSLNQAIQQTADFWQGCPFAPYYLDPEDVENWPSPWDLIAENYYCDLAKALGIVYTIHLTEHGANLESEIRVYYDPETQYSYNLAIFDKGKYVVNLVEGEIVNIESITKKLKLKYCFGNQKLKLY